MRRPSVPERLTVRESLDALTVEGLKPLLVLARQDTQGRKDDLVARLAAVLEAPEQVRGLYARMDEGARNAVREATNQPDGALNTERFRARYGHAPDFGGTGRYASDQPPTLLRLFFPGYHALPKDLQAILRTFVPAPSPLAVEGHDDLPARVKRPHVNLGRYYGAPDEEEVELRVRHTARAAQQELRALLRLVDAGEVKVSEKTRKPGQSTLQAVERVLVEGDFYAAEDATRNDWDPSHDLLMKPFAWPLLLQAAGLAKPSGGRLELTPAGRKATLQPTHEVVRAAWARWCKTTLLDEFNRVAAIKGQQARGSLSAVAPRRQAVAEGLKDCPPGRWVSIDVVWRLLRASGQDVTVANNSWKLYLGDAHNGSLGYTSKYAWQQVEGRYVLALLFEYAATLGLIDVAYIPPDAARNDFRDRWGTDDLSCLSRYDGLLFVRINALGAWCLGLVDNYEPEALPERRPLQVLPNLDVVVSDPPLDPADRLLLDRFTEQKSEAVWHLAPAKALTAVEEGLTVGELREFLVARNQGDVPANVVTFLDDLTQRAGQLADLGTARLIACADANVARMLAHDRKLRALCQLAGDRQLVFRASDEAAVRRAIRDLGFVLPPPR